MKYNYFYLDTNVLINAFFYEHQKYQKQGISRTFNDPAACANILNVLTKNRQKFNKKLLPVLFVADVSVVRFISLLQNIGVNKGIVIEKVKSFLQEYQIVCCTTTILKKVVETAKYKGNDIEDLCQAQIAIENDCFHLVTMNDRDFVSESELNVINPRKFKESLFLKKYNTR